MRRRAALGTLNDLSNLTLDQAAGRWYLEAGCHWASPEEVERRLAQLLAIIGPARPLAELGTEVISRAVEVRRGMTFARSSKKGAKTYLPSNATVNRDIIDTLRPILNRARKVWEVKGLPEVNWKALRLKEPREVVRTYTEAEQDAWLGQCDAAAQTPLRTLLRYGLRFGELFFPPSAFEADADGARLVLTKRKADVPHIVPLRADDARIIAALVGRATAAGLKTIWFEEGPRGRLLPLTYHGLKTRLRTAAARAGIKPGRIIHGARHHAGTSMLRKTGNLKMAQKLLGHASIQSTMRYAHAVEADLRAALEQDSRNSPEVVPRKSRKPRVVSRLKG